MVLKAVLHCIRMVLVLGLELIRLNLWQMLDSLVVDRTNDYILRQTKEILVMICAHNNKNLWTAFGWQHSTFHCLYKCCTIYIDGSQLIRNTLNIHSIYNRFYDRVENENRRLCGFICEMLILCYRIDSFRVLKLNRLIEVVFGYQKCNTNHCLWSFEILT